MSNAQKLRAIFEDVQVRGRFERGEVLAELNVLIDMADRLERCERACEIRHPDSK